VLRCLSNSLCRTLSFKSPPPHQQLIDLIGAEEEVNSKLYYDKSLKIVIAIGVVFVTGFKGNNVLD